jgi:DNA-binding Lrp family transcriptional regulator
MDELDRAIVRATQAGLPLTTAPYADVAAAIGSNETEVMARMRAMLAGGELRRLGAVPNHYALGFIANGMTVWDVDDQQVSTLGRQVGALPFVSHCYRRPRRLPLWSYNLFAMVHARTRDEVEAHARDIAALLGSACRSADILYSRRVLKKTGLRLAATPKD